MVAVDVQPAIAIKERARMVDARTAKGVAPPEPVKGRRSDGIHVTLTRSYPGHHMGLRLDASEPNDSVFIMGVAEDPSTVVGSYNKKSPEDQRIRIGDYIVAADGSTDLREMKDIMHRASCDIVIKRARCFTVSVPKRNKPLGLGIRYDPAGMSLSIKSIDRSGAVHGSCADVVVGDRIVAVNGVEGSTSLLLAQLRDSDSPQLLVSRCPAD